MGANSKIRENNTQLTSLTHFFLAVHDRIIMFDSHMNKNQRWYFFFSISKSSHHNYFQPHIENIANKLTLSLPVERYLMSKEECFPIDYLMSQDILLEF